jgi:hypothetical protein
MAVLCESYEIRDENSSAVESTSYESIGTAFSMLSVTFPVIMYRSTSITAGDTEEKKKKMGQSFKL